MRLTIAAVGRLRPGPELSLVDDYLDRAEKAGRALALGPFQVHEIDDRKAQDKTSQSRRLLDSVPQGAVSVALDERGKALNSIEFSQIIARIRDDGCPEMMFLIGGAEGLDRTTRDAASRRISLGPMVWPHMLVRVMLAEQLYRTVSILAGSPYHRA